MMILMTTLLEYYHAILVLSPFFFSLALCLIARRLRLLSSYGSLAAFFVGVLVIDAGAVATLQLLVFFFLASAATKYKQSLKDKLMPYPDPELVKLNLVASNPTTSSSSAIPSSSASGSASASASANIHSAASTPSVTLTNSPAATPTSKLRLNTSSACSSTSTSPKTRPSPTHHQSSEAKEGRGAQQVLATGLVPALLCLSSRLPPSIFPYAQHWRLFYTAFMATNLADTLASECGMLSGQTPMLITHWHGRVQTGVDGGVTLLGTLASILGGLLIGAISSTPLEGAACGLIGSVADSFLGAILQSKPIIHHENKRIDGYLVYVHAPMTHDTWASSNALVNMLSAFLTSIAYVTIKTSHVDIWPLIFWSSAQLLIHLTYPLLDRRVILVLSVLATSILISMCAFVASTQVVLACAVVLITQSSELSLLFGLSNETNKIRR